MTRFLLSCILCILLIPVNATNAISIKRIGGTWRLLVDGKPTLLIGGELHNSTASTAYSLSKAMATVEAMGINTVLVPVTWEQLEPQEQQYNFAQTDDIINLATKHHLYAVILWFGTWKNGESSYAPLWVKQDVKRFFRVRYRDGKNTTIISPFCEEACQADARAFTAMMKHIQEKDTARRVIAIQVENEVGIFSDKDYSAIAQKVFSQSKEYKQHGNSDKGNQQFLGRIYAQYLEKIAKAGKKAYPLPMFTNCWLAPWGAHIGEYPNGGPVHQLLSIWKQYAPSIDWISPDLYSDRFREDSAPYAQSNNLFFIPETWCQPERLWFAYAERNAQCVAPFAIEDAYRDSFFVGSIKVLHELLPSISKAQGSGKMHGFMQQGQEDSDSFNIGDYHFHVEYLAPIKHHFGLVILTAPDQFLFSGMGARIYISHRDSTKITRFYDVRDVERDGTNWKTLCLLNGDQTRHNGCINLRGRTANQPYRDIPAPLTNISYSRITWQENTERFILPGIWIAKIYTIPAK